MERPTPGPTGPQVDEQGWYFREGMTLREAEELLDWLDQIHCPTREVRVGAVGTTVRWRLDPPHA